MKANDIDGRIYSTSYAVVLTKSLYLYKRSKPYVANKSEIEKQVETRSNSPKTFYNKWKPLIDANVISN